MVSMPAHADVKFGPFELQSAARRLLVDGRPARLGARAFDVLLVLIERRERVVSKDELLDLVWPGLIVEENNLQVHISALRKVCGPPAISTIPGRGYRFTALLDADAASAPQASADAPVRAHNLPQLRSRFIGREAAVAACMRLLDSVRLLTLTGIGGGGKTRLALQVAQQQIARHADGVWWVDLAAVREPESVATTLAASLGLQVVDGTPGEQRLLAHLAAGRAFILFDNCEHVLGPVAELVDRLLDRCTHLRIMVTSREGLGLAGEQVYPVAPLSLPAADATPAEMQQSEAVRLFLERASLVLPEFAIDAANAAAIGSICCQLDGIALAIELAAARVAMFPVSAISARLDDRFRFLVGGGRAFPRHQTLETTLQWSYDSLNDAEKQLFAQLSVFVGGCTLAAAAHVADQPDEYAVLALLTRLHDKSLLTVDRGESSQPRYRMLETVAQFARRRLGDAAAGNAVRDRHLGYFVRMAEATLATINGPAQAECLARLRDNEGNILAAHAWCFYSPVGAQSSLRLVAGLWRYWVASGKLERGYQLARTALTQAKPVADGVQEIDHVLWRCRALSAQGRLAFMMGYYDETMELGTECLELARVAASDEQAAAALVLQAGGLSATKHLKHALTKFKQAIDLAERSGGGFIAVAALHGLAEVYRGLDQTTDAERWYERAIAVARAMQDARATAVPLCNLARLSITTGKHRRARAVLVESLDLATEAGLQGLGEQVLDVSAGLAASVGEPLKAAKYSGAAIACMRRSGGRRHPSDGAFVEPLLASARAQCDSVSFDAAEAEGQALAYGAAVVDLRQWLTWDGSAKRQA